MSLPWPHRLWVAACALALAACASARALYYGFVGLPASVDRFLQGWILQQTVATTWAMITDFVVFWLLLLALPVCAARPRWFFRPAAGGGFETRPWMYSALWLLLLLNQGFFDTNRYLAPFFWLTLPLLLARPWLGAAGAVGIAGIAAFFAPDRADALGAALWALALVALLLGASRVLARRDRLAVTLFLLPLVQVASSLAPLVLPLHGGVPLGEGMAYSFCESPSGRKLFAAVPRCGTGGKTEDCLRGFVAEIDLRDVSVEAQHRILTDDFYGRIEELLCLEDTVQVGMNVTMSEGRRYGEDAMEFLVDDPSRTRTHFLGEEGGHRILHDRARDALLYMGHPWFFRVDRATGGIRRWRREGPAAQPIILGALHPPRDSLYVVEPASPARQIDLETLETVAELPHAAAAELAVDTELDRLILSGFWGVEVVDLASGQPLFRRRLGMIARKPVIDPIHGLVYVPTTGEGKIHVFDRESFEAIGQIPVGIGTRYPYVTRDGSRLFGGNERAYFHWDADALAARFRGEPDA